MTVVYEPIGVIRSGHIKPEETPIQPVYSEGCEGQAEVFPEFAAGLRDVEGFSHIYLLYHMHKADRPRPTAWPRRKPRPSTRGSTTLWAASQSITPWRPTGRA
jgi:tRNA (Thr-GGU) A37 N-methylase